MNSDRSIEWAASEFQSRNGFVKHDVIKLVDHVIDLNWPFFNTIASQVSVGPFCLANDTVAGAINQELPILH